MADKIDKVESAHEELPLEQAFSELEEVLTVLESEDVTLEEAFSQFQKGMNLLKHCNDTIDQVEKKVLLLNEDGAYDEF